MAVDHIRYDLLAQEALRSVVRRVLTDVAKSGLPGEHHFYIAFDTQHPGIRMSQRLRDQHPEEMTIVLQHQFWDLTVNDQAFDIGLSFKGVPERLHVPFAAIKGFFDPSVQFGLQFQTAEAHAAAEHGSAEPAQQSAPSSKQPRPERARAPQSPAPVPKQSAPTAAEPHSESTAEKPDDAPTGAEVVRLDRFRKK